MTHNANQIGELHEVAEYEVLLTQARTMDPSDERACQAFVGVVDERCRVGRISSEMSQAIVSTLCQRRYFPD